MKLLGYFFAIYGILGLVANGATLASYWRMRNSVARILDSETCGYTSSAFAPLFRHSAVLVSISLVSLGVGVYILSSHISSADATQDFSHLWQLIGIYALGFGVTVEAAHRSSTATGRLVSTELEWHFGSLLNLLYFVLSIWLLIRGTEFIPWWAMLPLELFAVQIGVIVAERLRRVMGFFGGFLFLISPINLIWSAYLLWLL